MFDFLPIQPKKTMKSMIVDVLSFDWPLTSKKIYNQLKKKYCIVVTYQAVFKTIKELYLNGIVQVDEQKRYSLNINWIKQVFEFSHHLKERYEKNSRISSEKLLSGEISSATFDNLFMFFDFIMDVLNDLSFVDREIFIYYYHLWWAVSFEGDRFLRFKEFADRYKAAYVICKNDTYGDRINQDFYNSFKATVKVKYNVDYDSNCDLMVAGDYVCQIFFENSLLKTLDKFYPIMEKQQPRNMGKILRTLFFKKTKVVLLVNKNKDIAQKIREDISKNFK